MSSKTMMCAYSLCCTHTCPVGSCRSGVNSCTPSDSLPFVFIIGFVTCVNARSSSADGGLSRGNLMMDFKDGVAGGQVADGGTEMAHLMTVVKVSI